MKMCYALASLFLVGAAEPCLANVAASELATGSFIFTRSNDNGMMSDDPLISIAANVYVQKGEGGVGLDAWLEMDESDLLSLAMIDCRKSAKGLNVQLGLYPQSNKDLPPELKRLLYRENGEQTDLFVCINQFCEERKWEFLASGFGDAFFTNISIDRRRKPIGLVRVMIPDEHRKYEYRGEC